MADWTLFILTFYRLARRLDVAGLPDIIAVEHRVRLMPGNLFRALPIQPRVNHVPNGTVACVAQERPEVLLPPAANLFPATSTDLDASVVPTATESC